jgi:hypothetical protein
MIPTMSLWHKLLPYLPFLILALSALVALYHVQVYW